MRNFIISAGLLLTSVVQGQVTTSPALNFIGYNVASDKIATLFAAASWSTSGTIAGECTGLGCVYVTACSSGTEHSANGIIQPCTSNESCVTLSIYQRSPNVGPSAVNYKCRADFDPRTVYREVPAMTTRSTSTSTSSSNRASGSTPTMTSPPLSGDTASSNNSSGPISHASSSSSKAWIAGAVIGPLVLLALLAGLVLWLLRRRGAVKEIERAVELENSEYGAGRGWDEKNTYANGSELPELAAPNQGVFPQELAGDERPVELPGSFPEK